MASARVFAAALLLAACVAAVAATPLDDYVNKPDSNYKWEELPHVIKGPGYTAYLLNMTSQQWLTPQDVSRSIWWHYMFVVVPDIIKHNTPALYITGGTNEDGPPTGEGEDELLAITLALSNNIVTAALFQVPNAHIVFSADPTKSSRSEDAIIAFTWYHFVQIDPTNPEWLLRLPMTKAAVRALDTITAFVQTKLRRTMNTFMVAGASKRGWTTWTTGAVDKRVIAIVPIVMDLLNFQSNIHHFWRALGGWTFAFKDYYALNFTANIDNPNMATMFDIIDPYVYRDRLTMPKFVIDSCGDEFFNPDDNHYWWDDMEGEIHLLMVQNAEHSLVTGLPEVIQGISSFMNGVLTNIPRPSMKWTMSSNATGGSITVTTDQAPSKVLVHHADTTDSLRRDWRLLTGQNPCPTVSVEGGCLHPVLWNTQPATQIAADTWTIYLENPKFGWRAFFIELEFKEKYPLPHVETTQINIIPDVFPFPDCQGTACKGTLL